MKFSWAAVALLLPCADSAGMTGDELLLACSAPDDSAQHRDCYAYIQGALDGAAVTTKSLSIARGRENAPARLFCISREEPPESIVVSVMRYLQNHPENRASSAASNTLLAVIDAYPCPKGGVPTEAPPERRDDDRDTPIKR